MSLATTLLQNIRADGQLTCECPYGQLLIEAAAPARSIRLSFSNTRTFRYFLDSIPGTGISLGRLLKYRGLPAESGLSFHLSIAGRPLLSAGPDTGLKANYRLGLQQWLLWKLGIG
ncbi:MAG: hypothetical protein J5I94_17500 [Phaeodactylibacter sp.]|nr:hypothetical protein [Phaeodactylibacter sp.]